MARTTLSYYYRNTTQEFKIKDVVEFKSDSKYTTARLFGSDKFYVLTGLVCNQISNLEEELKDDFIYTARGALVRRSEVVSIYRLKGKGSYEILLRSGGSVPISRRNAPAIRKQVQWNFENPVVAEFPFVEEKLTEEKENVSQSPC